MSLTDISGNLFPPNCELANLTSDEGVPKCPLTKQSLTALRLQNLNQKPSRPHIIAVFQDKVHRWTPWGKPKITFFDGVACYNHRKNGNTPNRLLNPHTNRVIEKIMYCMATSLPGATTYKEIGPEDAYAVDDIMRALSDKTDGYATQARQNVLAAVPTIEEWSYWYDIFDSIDPEFNLTPSLIALLLKTNLDRAKWQHVIEFLFKTYPTYDLHRIAAARALELILEVEDTQKRKALTTPFVLQNRELLFEYIERKFNTAAPISLLDEIAVAIYSALQADEAILAKLSVLFSRSQKKDHVQELLLKLRAVERDVHGAACASATTIQKWCELHANCKKKDPQFNTRTALRIFLDTTPLDPILIQHSIDYLKNTYPDGDIAAMAAGVAFTLIQKEVNSAKQEDLLPSFCRQNKELLLHSMRQSFADKTISLPIDELAFAIYAASPSTEAGIEELISTFSHSSKQDHGLQVLTELRSRNPTDHHLNALFARTKEVNETCTAAREAILSAVATIEEWCDWYDTFDEIDPEFNFTTSLALLLEKNCLDLQKNQYIIEFLRDRYPDYAMDRNAVGRTFMAISEKATPNERSRLLLPFVTQNRDLLLNFVEMKFRGNNVYLLVEEMVLAVYDAFPSDDSVLQRISDIVSEFSTPSYTQEFLVKLCSRLPANQQTLALKIANRLKVQSKWELAAFFFNKWGNNYPITRTTLPHLKSWALSLQNSEKLEDALKIYRRAVLLIKDDPEPDVSILTDYFTCMTELHPLSTWQSFFGQSNHPVLEEARDAVAITEQATLQNNEDIQQHRADFLNGLSQFGQAEAVCRRLMTARPTNEKAQKTLIKTLFNQKKIRECLIEIGIYSARFSTNDNGLPFLIEMAGMLPQTAKGSSRILGPVPKLLIT